MIRNASKQDAKRVVELLEASRVEAGFDSSYGITGFTFPFDPVYAERLFEMHLRWGQCLCIVYEEGEQVEGILMAVAQEHPFGPIWLARETVWFIDAAHRGGSAAIKMLDAYEKWATDRKCDFVGMAGMGHDPDVGVLYKRRGYRVAETHYLKAVA